jgi:MoxR-like ATPase
VFATQNPIEFEGTYPLPEAELDRFLVKIVLGYPAAETEQEVTPSGAQWVRSGRSGSYGIEAGVGGVGLADLRAAARQVRVEASLVRYVTTIVRATPRRPR